MQRHLFNLLHIWYIEHFLDKLFSVLDFDVDLVLLNDFMMFVNIL